MPPEDLGTLLARIDADAPLAQRHLGLLELLDWIRGGRRSPPEAALGRVALLLDVLEADPVLQARVRAWWRRLVATVDPTVLLADFGFADRMAFVAELNERLRQKLLPATPETTDSAALFAMAMPHARDAAWVSALDGPTLSRLGRLLTASSPVIGVTQWQHAVLDAIDFGASEVRAAGLSAALRQRMAASCREGRPFQALARAVDAFRAACVATPREAPDIDAAAAQLRGALDACRAAANSVYPHLNEHGISLPLVFTLRQLRERLLRIRELMDCLLSPSPEAASARLVSRMATLGRERRSVRALMAANTSLLAAKVAERSAETGAHYITRTAAEYRSMLARAAGGGAATAVAVALKFALISFGLAAFWGGFWTGAMYAVIFVCIQLLHWTLATKQPAMTAPAMAAQLKDLSTQDRIESFVDEVTHLVRSQVAAVVGNVGAVVPCVLLGSLAWQHAAGGPAVTAEQARYVLQSLSLLQPSTLLFAAFTGVLLFASSLVAGWAENGFVLHRLDSALRYHPRLTRLLGAARAQRWAAFLRHHISGLASNISLGLMLGLVPPVAAFFGLALDARHVTLSAGQLTAAASALGPAVLGEPLLWWGVAAVPLIGLLNLVVSFYLAFRLALRARGVGRLDRARLRGAILSRLRSRPLGFLLPP